MRRNVVTSIIPVKSLSPFLWRGDFYIIYRMPLTFLLKKNGVTSIKCRKLPSVCFWRKWLTPIKSMKCFFVSSWRCGTDSIISIKCRSVTFWRNWVDSIISEKCLWFSFWRNGLTSIIFVNCLFVSFWRNGVISLISVKCLAHSLPHVLLLKKMDLPLYYSWNVFQSPSEEMKLFLYYPWNVSIIYLYKYSHSYDMSWNKTM